MLGLREDEREITCMECFEHLYSMDTEEQVIQFTCMALEVFGKIIAYN